MNTIESELESRAQLTNPQLEISSYDGTMARIDELLGEIGTIINDLPGVFSTPQWGGRAYKLPGLNGNLKKPKLLAFVSVAKDETHVSVVFKLPKTLSDESIERYDWVEPFNFGNWKKAGWINSLVSTKRQLGPLGKLLNECRGLFPEQSAPISDQVGTSQRASSNSVAKRIERVIAEAVAEGWSPPPDDESFADG